MLVIIGLYMYSNFQISSDFGDNDTDILFISVSVLN